MTGLLASGCADSAPDELDGPSEPSTSDGSDTPLEERAAVAAPARRPVILVAGLMQDAKTVAPLADNLRAAGLDVTVWLPPNSGLDDIYDYAEQLELTVEDVKRKTGAAEVDLVGHSEGGLTARRYLKNLGGDAPVRTLVSLGSPQQGTQGGLLSLVLLLAGCETWSVACTQMIAGSAFLQELNGGDPTPGQTRYVTVATRQDGVVQPVGLAGIPGAENVIMQEACRYRRVGHFGLFEDAWVHQVVRSVLAGGPAVGSCSARPVGPLL